MLEGVGAGAVRTGTVIEEGKGSREAGCEGVALLIITGAIVVGDEVATGAAWSRQLLGAR